MRLKHLLAAVPLALVAMTGVAAAPALADTAAVASVQGNAHVVIHQDRLNLGVQVANAIASVDEKYRDAFVRKAVDAAFNAAGQKHNVLLFNLAQNYEASIPVTDIYATVEFGKVFYGLWIFDDGSFTNKGDGGYVNWGMVGRFDRNGAHVDFHKI
jgi:hypothetical protein